MFKDPEKTLGKPRKYFELIGINSVTDIAAYLKSIQNVDPSVEFIYTKERPFFQSKTEI